MRRLQRQVENDELLLQSLTEQAANIRGALAGLSEEDNQTLESKALYDGAAERLQLIVGDIDAISDTIDGINDAAEALPTPVDLDGLPEHATLAAIEKQRSLYVREAQALIRRLVELRNSFVADEGEYRGELATQWLVWGQKLDQFNQKYEAAKGRATAHSSQLTQLGQIEKRAGELRGAVTQARKEIAALGKPEASGNGSENRRQGGADERKPHVRRCRETPPERRQVGDETQEKSDSDNKTQPYERALGRRPQRPHRLQIDGETVDQAIMWRIAVGSSRIISFPTRSIVRPSAFNARCNFTVPQLPSHPFVAS